MAGNRNSYRFSVRTSLKTSQTGIKQRLNPYGNQLLKPIRTSAIPGGVKGDADLRNRPIHVQYGIDFVRGTLKAGWRDTV
jgi:hypothetical protein